MTVLVLGATGATGRLLAKQLLDRGVNVRAIVRSPEKLPAEIRNHPRLTAIEGSALDLSDSEIAQHVRDCSAVISCLGHTLNLKGIYGHPRMLVTETTRRLCSAIKANKPSQPVRFVLMNTAGNRNRDIPETISFGQRCAISLIRLLLPPHRDNENAADYLRTEVGNDDKIIEWAVVRPDTLVNHSAVSQYDVCPSPIRSALFNPGRASRINVAHFMVELVTDDGLWDKWKGQMPVIYNKA
jgi:NAD(P)-dependent dehydrogenase (short-subunit alcohol dehydrogenase family)